ncbi:hypothetical protein CISIN_1g042549mg [Citrus sinensis]|uniref:Uncharacterized protein n=1 Tax=Citrus sinensis TaxID=2711 RepID=A0A067FHN3_CITSI|nr:hypothetical protein CISIN_1g042549mg [Citrus sinensis]
MSLLPIMLSKYCSRVAWNWNVRLRIIFPSLCLQINIINKKYITMNMNLNFICHMMEENFLRMSISNTTSKMREKKSASRPFDKFP